MRSMGTPSKRRWRGPSRAAGPRSSSFRPARECSCPMGGSRSQARRSGCRTWPTRTRRWRRRGRRGCGRGRGAPARTTYRGYELFSSPPTSRTGLEVMMQLNLVEAFEVQKLGHNSAEGLHLIAEAIKGTKSDVYRYVADPKFVDVPVAELLSKEYAGIRRPLIAMDQASAFPAPGDPRRLLKTEAGGSSLRVPSPDSPEQQGGGPRRRL